MKNSNDTIGNRTHDLPSCSAVPQPTAPPRGPLLRSVDTNLSMSLREVRLSLRSSHETHKDLVQYYTHLLQGISSEHEK